MANKKKNIPVKNPLQAQQARKTPAPGAKVVRPVKLKVEARIAPVVWAALIGVLILTTVIYSNSLHGKILAWDDLAYVTENPDIQTLDAHSLTVMFKHFYVGNWQPLTILTYALEYPHAQNGSTFIYHFDNLLLHLLNIILIFFLIVGLTRNHWAGILAILFFAINPLRVESVSWIAERKDVLYAFFFLLSLISYVYYLKKGHGLDTADSRQGSGNTGKAVLFYSLTLLLFVMSALSKSAAVVLPVVLLLIDYLCRRKYTVMMFVEKIPLFAISAFVGMMAIKSQGEAIKDMPIYTLVEKLLIVNHSFLRYIFMTFVPVHLSALHPYPYKGIGGSLPVLYYVAPLITLGLVGGMVYSLKFTRKLAFGLAFFFVTIALVLQLVPVGGAVIAERYTYIPHVGLFFVIAYYLVKLWEKKNGNQFSNRLIVGVIVGAGLVGHSAVTYSRNNVWKDDLSLWNDAVAKDPQINGTAYYNRGKAFQDIGSDDKALEDYNKAVFLRPSYDRAIINRGLIKQNKGDYKGALEDYNKAIVVNPEYYIVYNNRGAVRKMTGDLEGALEDFKKSVKLEPRIIESLYNLGTVKYALKDYKGALEYLNKCLEVNPKYIRTYNYLGAAKAFLGDKEGACKDWHTGSAMGDAGCQQNIEKNCK